MLCGPSTDRRQSRLLGDGPLAPLLPGRPPAIGPFHRGPGRSAVHAKGADQAWAYLNRGRFLDPVD
jgi:hypothetical protein